MLLYTIKYQDQKDLTRLLQQPKIGTENCVYISINIKQILLYIHHR